MLRPHSDLFRKSSPNEPTPATSRFQSYRSSVGFEWLQRPAFHWSYLVLARCCVPYPGWSLGEAGLFACACESPTGRPSIESRIGWSSIDVAVAAAMIDRLVHHAEVVSLKGDSHRLKDRDLGRVPTDNTEEQEPGRGG